MKKKGMVLLILLLIGVLVFVACTPTSGTGDTSDQEVEEGTETSGGEQESNYDWDTSWLDSTKFVRIAGGAAGGSWYPLATRLAYHFNTIFPKIAFTGSAGTSIGNIQALSEEETEIITTDLLPTIQAYNGQDPFEEEVKDLRIIGNFQITNFVALVRADSDIYTFEDMLDKRITAGRAASTFTVDCMNLLGLSEENIKAAGGSLNFSTNADGVRQMQDNQADVYFTQGFIGKPDIMSLDETIGVRWIGMTEEQANKLLADESIGMLGSKITIPKGALKGQTEEALTIGMPQVIVTSDRMPEQLIYNAAKILVEKSDDIGSVSGHYPTKEDILIKDYKEDIMPPYHEGAIKYYKEIGVMQ